MVNYNGSNGNGTRNRENAKKVMHYILTFKISNYKCLLFPFLNGNIHVFVFKFTLKCNMFTVSNKFGVFARSYLGLGTSKSCKAHQTLGGGRGRNSVIIETG